MTIKIEITVPEDVVSAGRADLYVSTALGAIGYAKVLPGQPEVTGRWHSQDTSDYQPGDAVQTMNEEDVSGFQTPAPTADDSSATHPVAGSTVSADTGSATEAVRPRGKAGEGRKRRTNAEIAEDTALEQAASLAGLSLDYVDDRLNAGTSRDVILAELTAMTGVSSVEGEKPLISTGEERISPEDAADEAAEVEAGRKGDALTHADLTAAVGRYQRKFGMEAAIADTVRIIGCPIAEVELDALADAIAKVDAAVEAGRPEQTPAVTPATKGEVGQALMDYARKFDGADFDPGDPSTYPVMFADGSKVFTMLFGAEVTKLSQVPDTGDGVAFGRALAGIREMTEKNPFGREAK